MFMHEMHYPLVLFVPLFSEIFFPKGLEIAESRSQSFQLDCYLTHLKKCPRS